MYGTYACTHAPMARMHVRMPLWYVCMYACPYGTYAYTHAPMAHMHVRVPLWYGSACASQAGTPPTHAL